MKTKTDSNRLTITGYSTALFSTWYFIEELGLLFDAGDGISASLLQKSRKVKHAFISHPDRDHLAGLLQFRQLNSRDGGLPKIYYPKDSGSFPFLADFMNKFDPHIRGTEWVPIGDQHESFIKSGIAVRSIRNEHVEAPLDVIKSLSFDVQSIKQKLKAEFKELDHKEIQKLRKEKGTAAITEEVRSSILSYSGDTPVQDFDRWKNSKILIHEATFLDEAPINKTGKKKNEHSRLEEVIDMVSASNVEQLILGHFSTRYSKEQIDASIRKMCHQYGLNIPVYRVAPGEVARDILSQKAINA